MVNLLIVSGATVLVTVVGGIIGYLIFLWTRPKKMTWKANVYQVGQGVRPALKRGDRIISSLELNDLKPYAKDVIEKIYRGKGQIIYKLVKLNKVVDGIPSDAVIYWGDKLKEVDVLYEGETCTVMRRGYDKAAGAVFQPLPHDKINLIKGEMAIRKDRLDDTKDILQSITPWIVTGICVLGLIAIAYLLINGFTEISVNLETGLQAMAKSIQDAKGAGLIPTETIPAGPVPTTQPPPPTITG